MSKIDRVQNVNALVAAIAGCGRHFFRHGNRLARIELDARGRVWWIDDYTERRIYTHNTGRLNGFSHGGTLRDLVMALRDNVRTGALLRGHFGPWPSWRCGGDLWGYGQDMAIVRAAAIEHGLMSPAAAPAPIATSEATA